MLNNLIRVGPSQGSVSDLDIATSSGQKAETSLKALDSKSDKMFKQELDKQMKENKQVQKESSKGTKKKMTDSDDKKFSESRENKLSKNKVDEEETVSRKEKKTGRNTEENVNVIPAISNFMVSEEGEAEILENDKALTLAESNQLTSSLDSVQNTNQANTQVASLVDVNGMVSPLDSSAELSVEEQLKKEINFGAELEIAPQGQDLDLQQTSATNQEPMQDEALGGELNAAVNADSPVAETKLSAHQVKDSSVLQSKILDQLSNEYNLQKAQLSETTSAKELMSAKENLVQQQDSVVGLSFQVQESSSELMQKQGQGQDNSSSQKESFSQEQSKSSENLRKNFSEADLADQVKALHAGQNSFQSHLGVTASKPLTQTQDVSLNKELELDANVKEIMNKAQYLVTQGGGEMNVRMTPEGMGEVQLKVLLENGQVNIEMHTQDKAAKKLIEEQLSDLKSSLALHQMRVDHVKINNVTAVDTQNQAQLNSNLDQSGSQAQYQARQEAMNFSQSFTQQREHSRQSSSYAQRQGANSASTKPAQNEMLKQRSQNAYAGAHKGKSINMVA